MCVVCQIIDSQKSVQSESAKEKTANEGQEKYGTMEL